MIRLRVAGGTIRSRWVPFRFDPRELAVHGIVDEEHWDGKLTMGTAVIVDIGQLTLEEAEALERIAAGVRRQLQSAADRAEVQRILDDGGQVIA